MKDRKREIDLAVFGKEKDPSGSTMDLNNKAIFNLVMQEFPLK